MGTENTEPKISIEDSRRQLFEELKKKCKRKGEIVQKVVPFTNHDVPEYLKRLESVEEGSRKTRIIVT